MKKIVIFVAVLNLVSLSAFAGIIVDWLNPKCACGGGVTQPCSFGGVPPEGHANCGMDEEGNVDGSCTCYFPTGPVDGHVMQIKPSDLRLEPVNNESTKPSSFRVYSK